MRCIYNFSCLISFWVPICLCFPPLNHVLVSADCLPISLYLRKQTKRNWPKYPVGLLWLFSIANMNQIFHFLNNDSSKWRPVLSSSYLTSNIASWAHFVGRLSGGKKMKVGNLVEFSPPYINWFCQTPRMLMSHAFPLQSPRGLSFNIFCFSVCQIIALE